MSYVKNQIIIEVGEGYTGIDRWLSDNACMNILLVCGNSLKRLPIDGYFRSLEERHDIHLTRFSDFSPNPEYDSVVRGVKVFRDESCDTIIAVGGGSAMDVAKCIKLYAYMDGDGTDGSYLNEKIVANKIPFLAMPTTAGTGSEVTRFAVIYYKGVKQSVSDYSCIPDAVIMDGSVLDTLSLYQKKATMLDAFCHAIESYWSVNSTDESKEYSRDAIKLVLENIDGYLGNTKEGNSSMLRAANLAGKAINITQTTAGHAMCYKITGLYGCAHGHAAALCVRELFKIMSQEICSDKPNENIECLDPRGIDYLKDTLNELGRIMGCMGAIEGAGKFSSIFDGLGLEIPTASDEQLEILKSSVNPDRLRNHPVKLDKDMIDKLYRRILIYEG